MGNSQGNIEHSEELATGIFEPQKPNRVDKFFEQNTLRFNSRIHSPTVRITNDGRRVKRTKGAYGVCFSRRSVSADEYVYVRIMDVSSTLVGTMRFGLTRDDPSSLTLEDLPAYCDPQNNDEGRCCRSIPELYVEKNNVLFFYYSAFDARVMYGVNDMELGVFFSTSGMGMTGSAEEDYQVWIVIDLVGQTTAIEFAEPLAHLPRTPSLPQLNQPSPLPTAEQFKRNQSFGKSTMVIPRATGTKAQEDVFPGAPQLRLMTSMVQQPYAASFHSALYGRNVSLSTDKQIATRRMGEYCNCYVFSSLCLRSGERWSVTVLDVAREYQGGLAFGMTSCNPSELAQESLPDDSDQFLNRPEYWVVHKDMYSKSERGDVLTFQLTPDGEVRYLRNGHSVGTLMFVDISLPLWAFIDVYGSTSMIRNLGIVSADQPQRSISTTAAAAEPSADLRRLSLSDSPGSVQQWNSPGGASSQSSASIPGVVIHPQISPAGSASTLQQMQLKLQHKLDKQQQKLDRQQLKQLQKQEKQEQKKQQQLEKQQKVTNAGESGTSSSSSAIVGTAALTAGHLHKQQHLANCPRHPGAGGQPERIHFTTEELERACQLNRVQLHHLHHHHHHSAMNVVGFQVGASSVASGSRSSPQGTIALHSTNSTPNRTTTTTPSRTTSGSALDSALFDAPSSTPQLPPPLIPVPVASSTVPPPPPKSTPPAVPPRRCQPTQPPIPRRKSEIDSEAGFQSTASSSTNSTRSVSEGVSEECAVCMERAPDCVLYTCGHMCMCFECAMDVVARSGACPICRNKIQDVIKIFRS